MSSEANSFPTLPIIDLLDMEMATAEQTANLINQARRFLASVHASISSRYDEGNYVVVGERLNLLANVLPSSSMAKAIAIKAYHKKKLIVQLEYINDPDKKKLGLTMIKDLAKDHAANGVAMRLTDGIYGMDLDSRLSMEKLIEVIAHEMVHIKQFVMGNLKYEGRSFYWHGKKVIRSKINYYDHPWEIEAWSKEKVLASKIFKIWVKAESVHHGKYKRNKI